MKYISFKSVLEGGINFCVGYICILGFLFFFRLLKYSKVKDGRKSDIIYFILNFMYFMLG